MTDWPIYTISYHFDGGEYAFNIPARDAAEASRRLRAIGMTGKVDGELVEIVPDVPGAGIYVRLRVLLRNLFGGRS